MTPAPTATHIVFGIRQDGDEEVLVVNLADSSPTPNWQIEFQHSLGVLDGRPIEEKVNTYRVVLNSAPMAPGCLKDLTIMASRMNLTFVAEAAELLGIETELEIPLELSPSALLDLIRGVRTIVGDGFPPTDIAMLD